MYSLTVLPIFTDPEGQFPQNCNRRNFLFTHELTGNPLFDLDCLRQLIRRMPDDGANYWSNGPVAVSNTWSEGVIGRYSLQATVENIYHNNSTVILRHAEQDPEFAPLLHDILATLVDLSGEPIRSDVTRGEVRILISSPHRIAPYHMVPEMYFLLQVAGAKKVHIFDHSDSALVTEEGREAFFADGRNDPASLGERRDECDKYDLRAGDAVHVPSCAPHWAENREDVSVALGVSFGLRSVDRLQKVYKFNQGLRKLGLSPTAPLSSKWRDTLKVAAMDGIAAVKAIGHRR